MKQKITVVFFLLLMPTLLFASTTGRIKGKVTDLQTGEPLIGANVIVVGTSFGAATDVNGDYTVNFLDAAVYTVKATYLGYKTVTISNVRVNADLATELNFQLPASGVSVGEVEIVAQRPLVNKSNTNAIRTTTNAEIDALPIRGVDNIIALTPGVTLQGGSVYIRGGRQDEVGYYLEGSNITNAASTGLGAAFGRGASRQVTIPQDALEEIQVQAGGYTAEFGGANAGIIREDLKSGGPALQASLQYITDNWTFKNSKNRYNGVQNLGAYSYGYNDVTASLSGPLVGNHIKFFGLFDNLSQTDANPQQVNGFNLGSVSDKISPQDSNVLLKMPGGPIPGNRTDQYSGVATLTFDYNPTIVRLLGTYTFDRQRIGGGIYTMFDNNRLPIRDTYNGDFGIKVTQILSSKAYVEANASYIFNQGSTYDPQLGNNFWTYGDSVTNAKAGVPWYRRPRDTQYGRYTVPLPYQLFSTFGFAAPNTPLVGADPNGSIVNFNKYQNTNLNLSASLSDELNKENSIKVGGELQLMTFSNYTPTGVITNLAGTMANTNLTEQQLLIKRGVNNYGYDVLGNSYTGSTNYTTGQIAPHRPVFAGVYVEDRMEYKNLIVNAGLRYDYINTDNQTFVNPAYPGNVFDASSGNVTNPSNFVKVSAFSALSPRLGFSFPITDQTVFHAQYGKFVQQPSLNDLYQGPYQLGYWLNPNNGFFIATPVGMNVRPTRTTQYEIGFTQQIASFASFDITAYYKDISNQVIFGTQNVDQSTGWRPYSILTNGDYATTQGIEISFDMRRTERFLVNGSVSYQDAKGTGDNPYSNAGEFGSPVNANYVFIPNFIVPLSFNHAFSGHLNIDYRYGKDDGPDILHQFGVSLLMTFSTGHPYTLGTATTPGTSSPTVVQAGVDTRSRTAIEALNSSVTPSNFEVDLRLDKTVELPGQLSANIFIQVINLFNTQNVEDVFSNTGSAQSNGYLTDPNQTGYKQVQKYGPQYAQLYQAININYAGLYGTPRQIRLGIRLEY
ncbi:MAG: TonB-dependent receptor [Ignavibacteriaceae bacterium]